MVTKTKLLRTLPFAALLAVAASIAADGPTLSGKWSIHRNAGGRESDQECTFTQKGNDLAGTCTAQKGDVELSGKIDGNKVTWTYRADSEGGMVTVVYKGSLDSATKKMSGIVSAVEFGIDGEFTATQSK